MNKIKQYPSYKDSKIKWIGEIPEQWSSHRIKDFVEFEIGGTPSTSNEEFFEGNNIWISIADLTNNNKNTINNSKTKITDEAIKKSNVKLIKKGSLLFSFKLTVGETAFAGCDLYTNEAIASFKQNKNISLNYLKYLFKVGFENNAFENIYGAKIFNSDLIKFAKIIKPSFIEQEQIAKYLDTKTTKIEQTITKNKKLIELLKEKRTSIINQAVTKGLNPNVQMKESGIEWIGEIPEDWDVSKLKFFFNFGKGLSITKKNLVEKGISIISYGQIHSKLNKGINVTKELIRYVNKKDIPNFKSKVKKNDFIFADTSEDLDGCGNAVYIDKDILLFAGYHVVVLKSKINKDNKYLAYLFKSSTWRSQIRSKVTGVKVYSINQKILKESYILIPSLAEQKQIADYLDKETSKIDKTIEKIEKNIELLKEYKKSLIHHVVTGKIDVRGVEV